MRASRVRAAAVVFALAAACSGDGETDGPEAPSGASGGGAQTLTVLMDAPTTDEEGLTYAQFFPAAFAVHPGDTIDFANEGTMNPHTITFGGAADRSDLPALLLEDGSENLPAFEPCYTAEPPSPDLRACPEPPPASALDAPAFDGTGYWSSGVEDSSPLVHLDPAIPPGVYPTHCLIHLGMSATMEVVPADEPVPAPAEVETAGRAAQAAAVEVGDSATPVPEPSGEIVGTPIVAGWSSPVLNVNRFEPEQVTIGSGDAVTWSEEAGYGHNVVFADLVDGEVIESAVLYGKVEDGIQTFTVEFPDAGSYDFVCTFHTSMTGTVTVT